MRIKERNGTLGSSSSAAMGNNCAQQGREETEDTPQAEENTDSESSDSDADDRHNNTSRGE